MDIITRQEAKERGLTRYFTGKPCPHGHVCEHLVSNWVCVKCLRARTRKWEKDNPEKKLEEAARYRKTNPEKVAESNRKWQKANPGKVCKYKHKWLKNNRETYREIVRNWNKRNHDRVYETNKTWRKANLARVRELERRRSKANPHKIRAKAKRRHAIKLKAMPSWLTAEHKQQIADIYEQAVLCEQLTGVKHHVDHEIPLRGKNVRGLHVPWNLQVLEARENLSKGNRTVRHFHWKKR